MAVTINADTVVGGAIVTSDASGVLALQAAGNTGLTLNSSRAVGVGASPSFGSSGQVLTSAGSGAAPTWAAPSSGALVYLATLTASNSATLTYSGITSTYPAYMVVLKGLRAIGGGTRLLLETRMSDASFILVNTAALGNSSGAQTTTAYYATNPGTISGPQLGTDDDPAASGIAGNFYIYDPSATAKVVTGTFHTANSSNASINQTIFATGGFQVISSLAVTGFRLLFNSGNINSGSVDIYGIANS